MYVIAQLRDENFHFNEKIVTKMTINMFERAKYLEEANLNTAEHENFLISKTFFSYF